ncbi:CHAT domain-containing protein [Terrabacter carboxydivorans]|uniref:CHAT domain-containing protein n=1 Tax=Terrabacter carboxydivorans TaxID=619730 RepID=A0ABN3M139_9MICO
MRAPRGYDASAATDRTDRDLPTGGRVAQRAALVEALRGGDFDVVDRIDLTPRRGRDLDGRPPANRRGTVALDVDVPAGEDAVVLLERDGLYSWHLPVDVGERTRSLDRGPRTVSFALTVQPEPARPPSGAGTRSLVAPPASADRGLLGDIAHGALQAIVLRFAAPLVVGKVVEHLESGVRTGLVHVTGGALADWRPVASLAEVGLPTDRPARVLLLVHGTFSSTTGAFGALAVTPGAEGFVDTLVQAYDAVIGFDHRTLSVDPEQNARDLLALLAPHDGELVLDVITHSRGGLVTRSFVEAVLPGAGLRTSVDSIVFVAATNGGTHLADPERWHDLVDLYTNLVMAGAAGLSLVPGGAPFGAIVSGVVTGIGALVKYLVSYAAGDDGVPGLAAMTPDGSFVTTLNDVQPGQPAPGTDWHVVTSDFHVSLFDDHHNPPEFPRELAVKLAEGFVDGLFHGRNDLVVDTDSMSAIGGPAGGYVRDTFALGTNDVVHHVNYFSQLSVIGAISQWLPLGLGASDDESHLPAWMTAGPDLGAGDEGTRGLEMAEAPLPPPAAGRPPTTAPRPPVRREAAKTAPAKKAAAKKATAKKATAKKATAKKATEGGDTTSAELAAEMPSVLVPGADATVRVRLARQGLAATEGTVHVEQTVQVDAERPVSVQVYAKDNVQVLETDAKVFGLPSGDWASELTFRVRALAAGPVRVSVVLRQGWVPVATLTLEATAGPATVALPAPVTATVHAGIDAPQLDGLPCLDIVEGRRVTGERVYSYALRLVPGEPERVFESAPIVGRDDFVHDRIAEVERVIKDPDLTPRQRLSQLQNTGTLLFDQFFPEDMQRYLWQHRDLVHDLIVYTDEPFVPWELVHLKPPRGKRGTTPRFLASGGLVRWQLGSFPPREVRVRRGHARSICPVYADPMFKNDVGVAEAGYLRDRFGATAVTATPTGVERLLRGGGFDLLHFSGHGAARSDDIAEAKVLLKGQRRGSTVRQQYLSATDVSENLDWTGPDSVGPLVVLNACQTGRSGELFTTVGGFAKAFLDAGASAFVSCLWSVQEEPARVFVETLYEELLKGTTMSRASAFARAAARDADDPTWLAYVVYARPDATLQTV